MTQNLQNFRSDILSDSTRSVVLYLHATDIWSKEMNLLNSTVPFVIQGAMSAVEPPRSVQ